MKACTQTSQKQNRRSLLPLALGLALLSGGVAAKADTYTVTNLADSGAGSLREAIITANAHAAANTIVFKKGVTGTIALNSALPTLTGSLSIVGPGANLLGVRAEVNIYHSWPAYFRVFSTNGAYIYISGLTISRGYAPVSVSCCGGGICNTGNLQLSSCFIADNEAGYGNWWIYKNGMGYWYPGYGGGIYNSGTATLENCSVSGNTVLFGGNGGGIYNHGSSAVLTLQNTTVTGNTYGNVVNNGGTVIYK